MINHAPEWLRRIKGIKALCVSLDVWGELRLKVAGLVQTRTTVRLQYDTYVFCVQVYVQYLGGLVLDNESLLQTKKCMWHGCLF